MPSNHRMTEIWESPFWPNFNYDRARVEPVLVRLADRLGQVRGLHAGLSPKDRDDIILREITQEAVHSFGIEGVTLNADEIQASVVASLAGRNLQGASRRSKAVAQMMLEARDLKTNLTQETLCGWHRLLFAGTEVEDIGRWRQSEMVIIKSARADREDVLYKAIPAEQIVDAMDKWVQVAESDDKPPVAVFAALMHLWFESIHPFSDGNGRIGRAIVENIFAKTGALQFSLSRQIEADKKGYYNALQAGRVQGDGFLDATDFVLWFLETAEKAAENGVQEALFLVRRNQFFMRFADVINQRQERVLRRLFEQGSDRLALGISNKAYTKIAKVSVATATRDLADLLEKGIVQRSGAGGRSTTYLLADQGA